MDFKQKEKIYLSPDKVREIIKNLEPGTMVTFDMPGITDDAGPDRTKEGEHIYGRPV